MPHGACELHLGGKHGVLLGEGEGRCEGAALVLGVLGAHNDGLPDKVVAFVDGPCGNTGGWVLGDPLVLLPQPLDCYATVATLHITRFSS